MLGLGGLLVNAGRLAITPLDTDLAARDELARRSTLTPTYLPEVRVRAQLDYIRRLDRDEGLSGASVHVLAKARIIRRDKAGYTPKRGDRVLAFIDRKGRRDPVNLYVARSIPMGATPGGFAEWELDLTDRHPAKASVN